MYGDLIAGACNLSAPSDNGMLFFAKLSAADGSCMWAREAPFSPQSYLMWTWCLPSIEAHGNGVYLMFATNHPVTLTPNLVVNPRLCLDQPESLEDDLSITKCASCRPAPACAC